MSDSPRIVLTGVDTLVVGWCVERYRFSEAQRAVLVEAKEAAASGLVDRGGAPIEWFGQTFSMRPAGAKGYEWMLENGDLTLKIASDARGGQVFPEVYATFRSAALWRMGYQQLFAVFEDWLSKWAVIRASKVSRVDLCADLAMPLPEIDLHVELVARGRRRDKYSQESLVDVVVWAKGRRDTGYTIGKGAMVVRIYDKTEEIKVSRKQWFELLWTEGGWDHRSPVTRFECQFRRKQLKQLQIDTFDDLVRQVGDLWRYATTDWMTVREPTADTNRSRWPVRDFWRVVQSAGDAFGPVTGIARVVQVRPNYEALIRQARGVLVTMGALELATFKDEELVLSHLRRLCGAWFDETFVNDVKARAAKLAPLEGKPGRTRASDQDS